MSLDGESERLVGPVLETGETADAVIAAIRILNPGVTVSDRGAYRRVLCPQRCHVTRIAVEQELGRDFCLPMDLERIMPAFKGELTLTPEAAVWR